MELMIAMEESDGSKRNSHTVHTQTDFGPYSAFPPPQNYAFPPPQSDHSQPSAPRLPIEGKSEASLKEDKKGQANGTNNMNLTSLQETTHLKSATETVERRNPVQQEMKEMNGLSKERISYSEELIVMRTSYKNALEQNPWDN